MFKGMCVSRKAHMSYVEAGSDEIVCWIDCAFYLMPVTSSKLSQFNLSWDNVKVMNPLDSECTEINPVFESTEITKLESPCNLSLSHSMFTRFFFSAFI